MCPHVAWVYQVHLPRVQLGCSTSNAFFLSTGRAGCFVSLGSRSLRKCAKSVVLWMKSLSIKTCASDCYYICATTWYWKWGKCLNPLSTLQTASFSCLRCMFWHHFGTRDWVRSRCQNLRSTHPLLVRFFHRFIVAQRWGTTTATGHLWTTCPLTTLIGSTNIISLS